MTHALLAAVEREEIHALALDERRSKCAGVVTGAWPLDLDDLGSEV